MTSWAGALGRGQLSSLGLFLPGKTRACAANSRPVNAPDFHATDPRCAQERARSVVAKWGRQIAELLVDSRLIAKATVFSKYASKNRLHQEKSQDLQVLVQRILTGLR